jgi:YfiH family protein
MTTALTHPLLEACGVRHGFGTRNFPASAQILRPKQVHGRLVAEIGVSGRPHPVEADAIVASIASTPGSTIGVLTADCVPILLATPRGEWVAAIHAGWRGLAQGVITATLQRLEREGVQLKDARCVIGPHIGSCCYEVDVLVYDAMQGAFGDPAATAFEVTRPGHWKVALGQLVQRALKFAGVSPEHIGELPDTCTYCHSEFFHSYRRDGAASGRLVHFIQVPEP